MQKRLLGLLSIFFILTATAAGLVLVRQTQDLTPKAAGACGCKIENGKNCCPSNTGCPQNQQRTGSCTNGHYCENTSCTTNNKPNVKCSELGKTRVVDGVTYKCSTVTASCQVPCQWDKIWISQDGDGGGGDATPTPTPKCNNTNPNPAKLNPGREGTLKIFGTTFRGGSVNYKFSLKKNSTTCSPTNADKVVEARFTEGEVTEVDTELSLTASDKVCLFLSYKVGGQERQARGWIAPNSENKCTKNNSSPKDLSPVTEAAGNPFASQCWEIDTQECKFNSMGMVFTIGEGGAAPSPTSDPNVTGLKVRFQGITQKRNDQKIKVSFDTTWSETDLNITNNENGVYTIPISGVPAGTYNVRVKGPSHLQKLFANLVYNGVGYDLSTSESLQMRAGDVTDDNAITIEDIAQVSSFYTDFSVSVDMANSKMVASDINKDGIITIQDLALIAINWSDIKVFGDN